MNIFVKVFPASCSSFEEECHDYTEFTLPVLEVSDFLRDKSYTFIVKNSSNYSLHDSIGEYLGCITPVYEHNLEDVRDVIDFDLETITYKQMLEQIKGE